MIILSDPARIGPALAEVRALLGMSRRQCARAIAELTGRTPTSVNSQLWTWDVGNDVPAVTSLAAYLKVLGLRLALEFEEDDG